MGRLAGMSNDAFEMSAAEIGQRLGITEARVNEIQSDAMRKLRQRMRDKGLTFSDLFVGAKHDIAYGGHDE